jgi:hypothetical protein
MKAMPFYVKGKTTKAQWLSMLKSLSSSPDVILSGDRSIIVCSSINANQFKNEDQNEVLSTLDGIIKTEETIMGLDNLTPLDAPRVHKIMFVQHANPDLYMYAYWQRTAYSDEGVQYLLSVKNLKAEAWGPWHEIGHTYQQRWKWDALTEVTNNIYSLKVERDFGVKPNKLTSKKAWPLVDAFLALDDATRNFNTPTLSVFMRLAMFHQLYMAFGENFYIKQHKAYRLEKPVLNTDEAKMRWFMLNACKSSGKNLKAFFQKWGFKVNPAIYAELDALKLPSPETDLTLLRDI